MKRASVSAFIVTFNEQENIARCLESIKWVDEIVIVDSLSSDDTVEICRRYTDNIFQREWQGHVAQKSFALSKTTSDWALLIDADECLTGELAREMQTILASDGNGRDGYYVRRRTSYAGGWVWHGGWYPDYKLRLFRRRLGHIDGTDPHDKVVVRGRTGRLKHDLLHFSYASISGQIRTINHFSQVFARKYTGFWSSFRILQMVFVPVGKFFTCYVIKRGFLDGMRGLVIAVSSAFYVFLKYAKMWEAHRRAHSNREQRKD